MNHDVTQAVARLQARQSRSPNTWNGDLFDEALDSLLTHPDKIDNPDVLIRKALTHAHKKLKRRRAILADYAAGVLGAQSNVAGDDIANACEIRDFLRQLPIRQQDLLAAGLDPQDTQAAADDLGVPAARIRERISRARDFAREAWYAI